MKIYALIFLIALSNVAVKAQRSFDKVITRGSLEQFMSVVQTIDGGYAILGRFGENTSPGDLWLVKTDHLGDTLWTKTFPGITSLRNGDRALVQSSDSGLTFVAHRNGKAILVHTSETGEFKWEKVLYAGEGVALSLTSGNGYIVTGNGPEYPRYLTVCLAGPDGGVIWKKEYSQSSLNNYGYSYSWAIREIPGKGFIIAGGMESSYMNNIPFLARIGPTGDTLWNRIYQVGGDETFYSMDVTPDSGFIACGYMNSNSEALVMKFNAVGDTLWRRIQWLNGTQFFTSIRSTGDGGAVACGLYNSTQIPGKLYLTKYSSSGSILWEKKIGNYKLASGNSIESTADSGFIICGDVKQTDTTLVHGVLVKTDGNGNFSGIREPVETDGFTFYPNPASWQTSFILTIPSSHFQARLSLFDILGREVKTVDLNPGQETYSLDLSGLSDGIYIAVIRSGTRMITRQELVVKK